MAATKHSEEVHYHCEETSPLKSTFQVIHVFSCRCHKVCVCNNVGLRFVLLLVGGRGHDGLFFEMAVVWFMGHIFKPMSHHL